MSRDFNGTTDVINATVIAADAGDWTMGAWVRPDTAGENNSGAILVVGANTQQLHFLDATRALRALQDHATNDGDSRSSTVLTLSVWSCVVATYADADKKCRIYIGTLSTAMAESAGYSLQQAGTGARVTGGTAARIGNQSAANITWDGRVSRVFFDARLWTLDEMEAFRQGKVPVTTGSLRGYWPLDSPTASRAEDLSGNGANGTVTGTVVAKDPPIPSWVGVA